MTGPNRVMVLLPQPPAGTAVMCHCTLSGQPGVKPARPAWPRPPEYNTTAASPAAMRSHNGRAVPASDPFHVLRYLFFHLLNLPKGMCAYHKEERRRTPTEHSQAAIPPPLLHPVRFGVHMPGLFQSPGPGLESQLALRAPAALASRPWAGPLQYLFTVPGNAGSNPVRAVVPESRTLGSPGHCSALGPTDDGTSSPSPAHSASLSGASSRKSPTTQHCTFSSSSFHKLLCFRVQQVAW